MENYQLAFEAIGTHWLLDCFNSRISKKDLSKKVMDRVEEFDRTYSRFRKDSLVWAISQKAGEYKFPEDSKEFFALYAQLGQITNGAFTLLIGNTLSEAGYDADYSLTPKKINKVPEVSEIYSFDYPILTVKKPYILDFGGLGKGYLIDILSRLLNEAGVGSFVVDGGGDMYIQNVEAPVRIGLENPNNTNQAIGVIELMNKSICASSGNRRRWDKYHHIMDPKTLTSPENVLATWVVADNAITADGLATCLFLVPPDKLKKYFDFEYLILNPDFSIDKSEGFSAELFHK